VAISGTTDLGPNIGSGGGGSGVTSLNSLTGALTLVPGTGINITPGVSTITISSTLAGGTVTSVGLALPASVFSISGSPVTTSGTLTGSFITQSANTFFAGPTTGAAAIPTFRGIGNSDLSSITTLSSLSLPGSQVTGNISGNAANITAISNSTLTTLTALSLPGSQVTGNISGNAANVTGIVAVANGGTSNSTALGARSSTGLNIDQETKINATSYVILSTDRTVAQTGTMSAPITFTLPAASSVNAGQLLMIVDNSGTVSTTNTITITPHAGDTINTSASSSLIRSAFGRARLISDGVSNWSDPVVGISRGGTGLQTLPTSGQLLIGNSTTSAYSLNTLMAGPGISITNGAGTIQVNNTSIGVGQLPEGMLGDGVDGAATISSNTTLTRDMYYSSLTVNNGVTLNPGGYIIVCAGTLTNNGTIARAGNTGGTSGGSTAGGAGAAIAGVTVGTGGAGAAGGAGGIGNGASGASSGAAAGEGGTGGVGGNGGGGNGGATVGGSGGNSGVVTLHYFRSVQAMWRNTAVGTYMPTGAGGAGGAAGGGDGTNSGRGGGGGGSAGPCIFIICNTLVNNGTISAAGGNGGNGGAGATGNVGGGAGGGGGGGGKIMILANTLSAVGTLTAPGGAAGNGSAGAGTGVAGTAGAAGNPGYCTTFEATSGTWTTING
jgi:hypothetical protein